MGRTRGPKSKSSFGNYGLPKEVEKAFIELLKEKEVSAQRTVRALIKSWLKENGKLKS